jgi:hypothetical protein
MTIFIPKPILFQSNETVSSHNIVQLGNNLEICNSKTDMPVTFAGCMVPLIPQPKLSHTSLSKRYSLCTSHLLGLGCRTYCLRFCLVRRICFLCSSPWRRRGAIHSKFCSYLKHKTSVNCLITMSDWYLHSGTATKPYSTYPQTLKNSQSRCHCKKVRNKLLENRTIPHPHTTYSLHRAQSLRSKPARS